MSKDIQGIDAPPLYISCDPLSRQFPREWRDIRFRRSAVRDPQGTVVYICPTCCVGFDHSQIDFLQGDHIWPYSLFGESSWSNYQLICGSCNARKRDFVDRSIRQVLGSGAFRELVCDYLKLSVSSGVISETDLVQLLLSRQRPIS